MSYITFIGDVHGKYSRYKKILKKSKYPSVQIGDMGVGFSNQYDDPSANPPYDKMVAGDHRFIRGNHDNPSVCKRHTQWIKDGAKETTLSGTKIMYIGGAFSIDYMYRVRGRSWWEDEELSSSEFDRIILDYVTFSPDILVTHDCPQSIAFKLFIEGAHKPVYKTRTGQAFEGMLSLYRPKVWIFGHWHINKDEMINGTRFICLGELETINMKV